MICGIHQPNILPWGGYFHKMKNVDIFVILDNVQFSPHSHTNHFYIKSPKGKLKITLSIKRNFPENINKVMLNNYNPTNLLKTLTMCYKNSPNFYKIMSELNDALEQNWKRLADLNILLIYLIANLMNIKTKIVLSSNYVFEGKGDDRLINICKFFNCDTYYSGTGGKNYQSEKKFADNGIKVVYSDFVDTPYQQLWGDFIPNLSIIDRLFNTKI